MYLLKNSRYVLRKSQWISSNAIERNFRSSLRKNMVKWPEDDPMKPPLRLNIPKDKPVPGPCNFTQIQWNPAANVSGEVSTNWITPEVRLENAEAAKVPDEVFAKTKTTLQKDRNSSEVFDNQNFLVRSKSSESSTSIWNAENMTNRPGEKVKNFKLKKFRSYEAFTPKAGGDMSRDLNSEQKNGILTIEIELNNAENKKVVAEMSPIEHREDRTSNEQIKALAEAIANEINPNTENVDALAAKSSDKKDEAFLVIINVTDKSTPENKVAQPQLSEVSQTKSQEIMGAESWSQSLEDGCYGARMQVRKLSDEFEANACEKEFGGSGRVRESHMPTVGLQVSKSLESVSKKGITLDQRFLRRVGERTQYNVDRSLLKKNKVMKSTEDFTAESGKKRQIGSTLSKLRANRSHGPIGKKVQAVDLAKKKKGAVPADNSHEGFVGLRPPRSIGCGSEIGKQKKTKDLFAAGKRDGVTHDSVSREATFTDYPPEVSVPPDYKMLRKSRDEIKNTEEDKLKKSNTIRSYHNSCKNMCKLTKDIGEEKATLAVMNLDKKCETKNNGYGDNPNEGNRKTDPLRLTKEYSKSKLNNSCDVLEKNSKLPDLNGSNDVYLQEESVIGNNDQPAEEKTVSKVNHEVGCLKKEDDLKDERYELDIADARTSPQPVKVPYSAAYPSNRTLTGDERTRFKIFRDMSSETFEMNVNCLSKEGATEGKSSNNDIIYESPANGKVETIRTTTPKISDNIANVANEELSKRKGAPSLDSLNMMKQVREMVDFDLKNAEKIFLAGETEVVYDAGNVEEICVAPREDISPALTKSVVIYNDDTNLYYVNTNELKHATNNVKQEMSNDLNNRKIVDFNQEVFKGDLADYVKMPQDPTDTDTKYILKNGESILVYNEKTRKWNVDFSLLKEKGQTQEHQNGALNEKSEISPPEKPQKDGESIEDSCPSLIVTSERLPMKPDAKPIREIQETESENKTSELKRNDKKESGNEVDAKEIRKKNSDLYHDVFVGIKKPNAKKEEGEVSESPKLGKKAHGVEKPQSEHYISENILVMSKNNTVKPRSNKVGTVKLNITPNVRPPSKVREINLNKKNEEGNASPKKYSNAGKEDGTRRDQPNGTFYKKFEKYKTPFSDPEYEEKPMKINSDLDSNPNLKKLDSWDKTLVLQEISKSSGNVEGWLKDETDKMATLLLKALQDAADGNSRRRVAGKTTGKGNPYEAIRKKQENNTGPVNGKKREPGRKRMVPVLLKKSGNKEPVKAKEIKVAEVRSGRVQFPIIEDDSHVEILTADSHLPKEPAQVLQVPNNAGNEGLTDDIPGPYFLKRISSLWKYLPDLGCQTTILLFMRMFQMAKTGLSLFSPNAKRPRNDPFRRLFTKYGPIVKLQGPLSGNVVLINRPEDLDGVFNQAKAYPARSVLDSVETCRLLLRKKNFPQGVTQSCNGVEWDAMRKSMIDIGKKGYLHYFNALNTADTMFINKIQSIRNNQKQVPDDFINEVKKWSMEGLCSVLFDKSLGFLEKRNSQVHWIVESERLMRHLGEATDHLTQCESGFQTWRFIKTPAMRVLNQAYQTLDLIISKYVYQADLTLRKKKKALTNNKSNANKNLNFLESVLLNDRMTPDEITANLIDMLLIGVNTTTVALAFLLYNLAQNNRVQCLLFKEIKDLLPTKTSVLNYHQLHSLKYLQACLKESMRLNIPIPFLLRVLQNDIVLSNYRVPNGAHIVMDTQTACMREQVFDDPERFKPERWLEQDSVHPFSSVPFSNGPRGGFVKRLAEIQIWTCVAQIVRNYHIEYHFGDIRGSKGVISYPDKPLKLTFIERTD